MMLLVQGNIPMSQRPTRWALVSRGPEVFGPFRILCDIAFKLYVCHVVYLPQPQHRVVRRGRQLVHRSSTNTLDFVQEVCSAVLAGKYLAHVSNNRWSNAVKHVLTVVCRSGSRDCVEGGPEGAGVSS